MVLGFSFSWCSFLEGDLRHVLLYFLFKFVGDIYFRFVDSEFILVFYFNDQGPSVFL